MKKLFKIFALFLLIGVLYLQSCTKTDDPTADARDKFVGQWTVKENPPSAQVYAIEISKSGSSSINISGFAQLLGSVNANVSGSTFSLTPVQVIGHDTLYSGNGTMSGSTISIQFRLNSENLSGVCTKK